MGLKILIVDDHPMVRMGLGFMLRERANLKTEEATTAEEAIAKVKQDPPDVVMLDIRLPDRSGVETCRMIKEITPETKVIMITSFTDEEALFSSILAGANGYFLKRVAPEELLSAIYKVCQGESVIDSQFTASVFKKLRQGFNTEDDPKTQLNRREQQMLELIAKGRSNKDIAEVLFLSPRTVKNYTSIIFKKLGVNNRAEAAAFAVKQKWYQNN